MMDPAEQNVSPKDRKAKEAADFDAQTRQRLENGFVPDLRRLKKVDWFYNNVWRDPEMARLHWQPRLDKIIGIARESGGRVLELGCGCGMLSLELARNSLRVTGVDLSPVSIEAARKYQRENQFSNGFGELDYLCADFDDLDFEEETFDSVVFFRSLHHFADTGEVMDKVARLLKPGGNLLLSEPIRSHFNRDSARMAALLRLVLPTWTPFEEKLSGSWSDERIEEEVSRIFEEYTYDGDHHQSEMDNSTDSADDIRNAVTRFFRIVEEDLSDAFTDKLLGGLRGENRYRLASFLKSLDSYLVRGGILPPTSLELHAKKTG